MNYAEVLWQHVTDRTAAGQLSYRRESRSKLFARTTIWFWILKHYNGWIIKSVDVVLKRGTSYVARLDFKHTIRVFQTHFTYRSSKYSFVKAVSSWDNRNIKLVRSVRAPSPWKQQTNIKLNHVCSNNYRTTTASTNKVQSTKNKTAQNDHTVNQLSFKWPHQRRADSKLSIIWEWHEAHQMKWHPQMKAVR